MTPQAYAIPGYLKIDKAFEVISELLYFTPIELKSRSRKRDTITARSIIYNYLRNEVTIETFKKKRSLSKVGNMVSGLDHATVFNGIKTYNNLYETDKDFRKLADEFNSRVG